MATITVGNNYVVAGNSAMWINKATATPLKVRGLQGLGLALGFEQSTVEVSEMGRRLDSIVYSGAKLSEISVNANFVPGDASQEYLKNAAMANTNIKNVRMYLKDGCHFTAPDQISNPTSAGNGLATGDSGLNVGNYGDPSAGSKNALFANTITMAPSGSFALFIAHTSPNGGANIAVLSEATNLGAATIELIDNTIWDTLGFEDGDTILIDGDGTTPKYAQIASGANTDIITLTLGASGGGDAASLVDAAAMSASSAVHGASPSVVSESDVVC